jgi:hypothetical protein
MEIALITGIGFLGKAISDANKAKEIKKIVTSDDIYHTTIVDDAVMQRARLASNARELAKDPARTNIIPPLYPQSIFKKPTQEFGTITDMTSKEPYDYSQSMDALIWKKKQEVAALNDLHKDSRKSMRFIQDNLAADGKWAPFLTSDDMTYNVVSKDELKFDNMEHYTSQRDFSVHNDYNESLPFQLSSREWREQRSPLALELFTGSSKNYFQKQENVQLFEAQKDVSFVNGAPVMTGIFQERYNDAVRLERRNERPFEQRQVGPGLNLDVNQDSLNGFHDTTRVLPRNIDELRRADRKQETKTEPVNHGKLGDNMPVLTPWKKHAPETFREIDPSEYLPGSSQFSAARVRDNINLRVGNRIFSQEQIGAAKVHVPAFTNATKGEVQESQREVYREPDNQTVGYHIPKINQNAGSYSVPINQRNKTNIEYSVMSNPVHNKGVVNMTDDAKSTLRQTIGELPMGAAFGQNQHTKVYNQDEVRQTLRQMIGALPEGAAFGQNQQAKVYNQDEVRTTLRQLLKNINKDIVQGNIKNKVRFQDEANPTMRQTTMYEETGNLGSQSLHKLKALLQDEIRITSRQLLDTSHEGFIATSHDKHTVQLQDEVRPTTRQQTDNYDYSHGPKDATGARTYNQDEVRETLRNITKVEDYVGSGGLAVGNMNTQDYKNAHTNEGREVVSKGRAPTQTGPNMMATLDDTHVNLKTYQDLKRAWVPTAVQAVKDIDTERQVTISLLKNKPEYEDRLSYVLTQSLKDNPYVVNNKVFVRS